jgi:predicted DNA repair protein MutK
MSVGLLGLIDDVVGIAKIAAASIDDATAQAAKAGAKAAGLVVDDTAVTPRFLVGFAAERELPIIGRITLGSLKNKLVFLLPAALLLSLVAPWAITPLLMAGGLYLAFEGAEKVMEALGWHGHAAKPAGEPGKAAVLGGDEETRRVKSAIRTDFILSAEIVVIALGTVTDRSFGTQVGVLCSIALLMTVGVYGLVAGIVKLDDAGLYLRGREGEGALTGLGRKLGTGILLAAPWLMWLLSVAGTAAMFLVGGGILAHGIPFLHHWVDSLASGGGLGAGLAGVAANGLVGVVAGGLAVGLLSLAKKLKGGGESGATPGGAAGAEGPGA